MLATEVDSGEANGAVVVDVAEGIDEVTVFFARVYTAGGRGGVGGRGLVAL